MGLQLEKIAGACLVTEHGLHDHLGVPIRASYLARGFAQDDFPFGAPSTRPAPEMFRQHLTRPCLWVRFLVFWHFGHLLTETCGNLWPLLLPEVNKALPSDLLVLVPAHFRSEIPQLAALTGRECVSTSQIEYPALLEEVFLPQPSTVDRGQMMASHPRVTRAFLALERQRSRVGGGVFARTTSCSKQEAVRPNGLASSLAKVYVSRSRLSESFRRFQQEDQLEQLLLAQGWTIVHPERLLVADQVELLCSARVLAGCSGSAFHLLMARPAIRCIRLVILTMDYGLELNFRNQFRLQGLSAEHIPCLAHCGDKEGSSRDVQSTMPITELAALLEIQAAEAVVDSACWQGPVIEV
jgi:hypothetical protein